MTIRSSRAGVRAVRQTAGLTQDEVVQRMRQQGSSLTQTGLSLLESGLREASPQIIDEIRCTIELILADRLAAVRRLLVSEVRSPLRQNS